MKKTNVFMTFIKMLPKMWRVSPGGLSAWQISEIIHGTAFGLTVPVTQIFLDRATDFAFQRSGFSAVVFWLAILGSAHMVKQALNGIANFMEHTFFLKAEGVLSLELHEKMNRIAPVCFEDTKILDDMNKAVQGKNDAVWFTEYVLTIFTFYTPFFVVMGVYLYHIKPLLLLSLALVFVPVLLTQILKTKVFAKAEDLSAPIRREFDYYETCMTSREYFKETRILGAFSYFRKLYYDSLWVINRLRFRAAVKADLAKFAVKLLSLGGHVGIFLLLLDSLLKGDISAGAFAAVFSSISQMFWLMNECICDRLGAAARDFGRVRNYFRFLQMPERGGADEEIPTDADITLSGVSFAYPGAERKAVDGVTLTLKNGETIAVVGENGSGKSTLVRLITGIYSPDEGEVFYGGINTKNASALSIFKRTSAVFQKYQRYQMNLRENIGISDVNTAKSDAGLDEICVQAGVDKMDGSFTDGYETMLSREFDGVDLSGGQWQRVAIARSFFRGHQFIVLDEPTAAIDPIEETRIYNRFAEISKDKTAIIVTHRLGSVKLADRILVMKNGQLAEQGVHADLMAADGEYARLYRSQEQWYVS